MAKPAPSFPVLATRRLRLRRFTSDDLDSLHAILSDPEAMRYWNMPQSASREDTGRMLAWLTKTSSPYDHFAWVIAAPRTGRCIGMVNYHQRDARNRRAHIGYLVAPAHQGRGFATEAVAALLDHCTGALGIHRLTAIIAPENAASIRVVEKLGFKCEGGPLTDYWRVGDRIISPMLYARVGPSMAPAEAEPAKRVSRSK